MKKFATTLSVLAVVISSLVATAAAEVKIASVNMSELHVMFYKRVDAENDLRKQVDAIREEITTRQEKVKALEQKLVGIQKQADPTLSEAAVKKLREQFSSVKNEYDAERQEYDTFVKRRQLAINDMRLRMSTLLAREMHEVVQAVAAEEGVDFVIDSSAISQTPGGRIFPYVKPSMDISEKVIKRLNADAPAGCDAQAELQKFRSAVQQGASEQPAQEETSTEAAPAPAPAAPAAE